MVFGRASGFDPVVDLTSLDGQNGFLFRATTDGQSAYAVHAAGGIGRDLVLVEDAAQLAARLGELLRDSELRKKMGQAARQRAETHFSQARFVEDFLRLLRKPSPAETVAR